MMYNLTINKWERIIGGSMNSILKLHMNQLIESIINDTYDNKSNCLFIKNYDDFIAQLQEIEKSSSDIVLSFYKYCWTRNKNYKDFKKLIKEELDQFGLNPYIRKFTREMKIEFKIGNQRMYKLKDLTEFYDRMKTGEKYKYGNKLEFIHQKQNLIGYFLGYHQEDLIPAFYLLR